MSTILHLSDCHLVQHGDRLLGVDTQASLEAVLTQAVGEKKPDAVIASGDLAHDPSTDVYRRFVDTVRAATDAPLMCLPGNHDRLPVMQSARMPLAPLTLGGWDILWLDSHVDDQPQSRIDENDRSAIEGQFRQAAGAHCLIATHHPPVAVQCPWLDKDRIQNPEELLDWLREGSKLNGVERLRAVVFGHTHQVIDDVCSRIPVFGAPSTCFQFTPASAAFSIDESAPGYRWLTLAENGVVGSEERRVDTFPIHVQLK